MTKYEQFISIAYNNDTWLNRFMVGDLGSNAQSGWVRCIKAGFKPEEVQEYCNILHDVVEEVAREEKIYIRKMDENFSGWSFSLGFIKEASTLGRKEIGSMKNEKKFNRKVQQRFIETCQHIKDVERSLEDSKYIQQFVS